MNWRFNGYMPMQSTVNPKPPFPPTSGSNAQKTTQDKREIGMRVEKEEKRMEVKGAIEYLKNAQMYMVRSTGMSANHPLYKAFMLAISVLDKQMPKKIVTCENLHGEYDACPYCGCAVDRCYDTKCCRECGQALDWSGE